MQARISNVQEPMQCARPDDQGLLDFVPAEAQRPIHYGLGGSGGHPPAGPAALPSKDEAVAYAEKYGTRRSCTIPPAAPPQAPGYADNSLGSRRTPRVPGCNRPVVRPRPRRDRVDVRVRNLVRSGRSSHNDGSGSPRLLFSLTLGTRRGVGGIAVAPRCLCPFPRPYHSTWADAGSRLTRVPDSGDMFGESSPADENVPPPSAAELEAAGQADVQPMLHHPLLRPLLDPSLEPCSRARADPGQLSGLAASTGRRRFRVDRPGTDGEARWPMRASVSPLAHAFLMTGVAVVGKTSTARLIAKAPIVGPVVPGARRSTVRHLRALRAIAEGRRYRRDEMTTASHTGVDDVREIVEAVRYAAVAPASNLHHRRSPHAVTQLSTRC